MLARTEDQKETSASLMARHDQHALLPIHCAHAQQLYQQPVQKHQRLEELPENGQVYILQKCLNIKIKH